MQTQQSEQSLQRLTLTMVLLNAVTTPLMLSAVNVALPSIATDLSMNAVLLNWVPMAYLMASAMFVLIFGRIADIVGRKRVFLLGTSSVIVTSLIAASAESGAILVAARFLQGMSAAMLYATQIAIVSSVFSLAKRGRAIGLTVSSIYLGLTIGPLIGGYVVDSFGWRASFILHIPLAIIVLVLGLFYVKGDWFSENRSSFDLFGASIYIVSISTICVAISYLPSNLSIILLGLSLCGFLFLFNRVHKHPIFGVSLFYANRIFTFSCLASLIVYTATFANVVQVSLYLQYLKELSAASAGMIMMCQPLTMVIFSPLAGRLSDKFEPRYLATLGIAVSCFGLLLLSELRIDSDLNYLIIALITTGFGFSLFSSPNVNAIMGTVEKKSLGSANGVMATMRIFGQMTSMILVTLVFALVIGPVEIDVSNYDALEKAIRLTFFIAACLCLPGLYFSVARGNKQAVI